MAGQHTEIVTHWARKSVPCTYCGHHVMPGELVHVITTISGQKVPAHAQCDLRMRGALQR